MRHKAKVSLGTAAHGIALALACAVTAHGQVSLRQAVAQRGPAAAAQMQQIPEEVAAPSTVEGALKELASQAAVIFTGSVSRVTELPGSAARVDFTVEDGLRGVFPESRYSMRVSAWAGGLERYRVGERALFLLHAPSLQGFSSPVGGELGIVPLSGDTLVGSVDLRWIATVVQRTVATNDRVVPSVVTAAAQAPALGQGTSSTTTPASALAGSHRGRIQGASVKEQLAVSNVTGADVHAIDRDLVIGMLRTWAATSKDVR